MGERRKSSASMPRPKRTEGVKAAGAELTLRPIVWLEGSMKNMDRYPGKRRSGKEGQGRAGPAFGTAGRHRLGAQVGGTQLRTHRLVELHHEVGGRGGMVL